MRYPNALLAATMLCFAAATTLGAQAALRPLPSSRATSEVTLAFPRDSAPEGAQPVKIRLDYGQPHLRGRSLHTDSLVPYDSLWRTGANEATTLHTDVDLVVGGAALAKGTYVLTSLPSRAGWRLVLRPTSGPSTVPEVVRIDLRRRELTEPIESLSISLIPSLEPGPARGELRLAWGLWELSTDWSVK